MSIADADNEKRGVESMRVQGWVSEQFKPVSDVFATVLPEDGRGGGAVSLFVDGEPVLDLWGGVADSRTGRAWEQGTAVLVFSCAKSIVSMLLHYLAQEGQLDLDSPVASYWPEFGCHGKEAVTVRQVLTHRAGLPVVEEVLTFEDVLAWTPVVEALEQQTPFWEPGRAHAYHGLTFGWLAGEVIRRVTGRTPGVYFRELLGDRLGIETWIGLPPEEAGRVARLEEPVEPLPLPGPDTLFTRALTMNGVIDFPGADSKYGYGSPSLLAAELPAGNAVATARGLAATHAAAATGLHTGTRLLTLKTLTDAVREQSSGPSWRDGIDLGRRFGTGFMIDSPPEWRLLSPRSFGHDGAGGSTAFGDDAYGVGFGFVTNRLGSGADDRVDRLITAVRECLR
ncbi:serine hydrolase [Streptomyces sp. ACA25]|uniref:serine hydrolase domain-containing protein n=1 Tax=Streptomyces sp. ACA25 TaxID=3022596 RepID=UPI00230811ED|nr:serine hydrolase domain-containing protein [Streptomyces sp. ACA25]MDB1090172.1 serine hydrolase [Streptomyces sp. ACA25]